MLPAVQRPRAEGYGILLGDEWFRLALDGEAVLQYYTRDSLADRFDPVGSGGENVLRIGHAFTRGNLTGGEGLDWWPRQVGEEAMRRDETRFWDSGNVDLSRPKPGEPYQIKLARDSESFWAPASTPIDMATSLDSIYIAEGQNIHRLEDWEDTVPEDTRNLGVSIVSIDAADDDTVIAVDSTGDIWIKPSRSDVYVKCYDSPTNGAPAQAAWWVKGRIIVAALDPSLPAAGSMLEVDPGIGGTLAVPTATPAVTTIDTYSGRLLGVIDAGHAIVACFDDSTIRSYVPQSDGAGDVPTLTIRAQMKVPRGEVPYALGWNAGRLLVLTHYDEVTTRATVRLYQGVVLDVRFDYVVGDLQLLRSWNNTTETLPAYTKSFVASRDELWFSIGEDLNGWNIWRYDVVTGGLFRHHQTNDAAAGGLVRFQDQLGWIAGSTIWITASDAYAASGYLITPNITHGLNTPLNWTSFVMEVTNLDPAGAAVELYYSIDPEAITDPNHASWELVQLFTDTAQSGFEITSVGITASQLALQVKLYRSNDLAFTPEVAQFSVRAMPQHRDWVIEAPINISDWVTVPNRRPKRYPGLGDTNHRRLVALQGASISCQVLDPPIEIRGVVDRVLAPVNYITRRGSQGRYCIVRFVGNPPNTLTVPGVQGNEGLGISGLGIGTLGIEELL